MGEETTQPLPQDGVRLILARLDSIDSRLDNVEGRLSALEDKVDRRLQETRPMWEQVLARLDSLENETRSGFRRVERYVLSLAKDLLDVRADQRDFEDRMDKLESKAT